MSRDSPDGNRRKLLRAAGLAAGVGAGGTLATGSGLASASGEDEGGEAENGGDAEECLFDGPGLVTVESERGFDETVAAVEDRIEASPLTLMTTVDHAANAASVGRDLPPTTLFVFGNPAIGTQLMQACRTVAIDLPQKILVWCEDGRVYVTYNDPEYLAARHGIEGEDGLLETIATALETLATGSDGDGDEKGNAGDGE